MPRTAGRFLVASDARVACALDRRRCQRMLEATSSAGAHPAEIPFTQLTDCLLYTSDAADDM
eukprot:13759611-Alexandrium_andersonii.AAC.1